MSTDIWRVTFVEIFLFVHFPDAKSPNVDDDAIIVILCVGFIFVGLVSLSTFVLACHGCKKKTKM